MDDMTMDDNTQRTSDGLRRCADAEALISADLDGDDLSPPERGALDVHLRACPPCRAWRTAERARSELLRAELARAGNDDRGLARSIAARTRSRRG